MSPALIFSKYIYKKFFVNLLITITISFFLIFLIDFVELLKESADRKVGIDILFRLSLYKTPYLMQVIISLIVFASSSITIYQLNSSSELIIAKATGISAWKIIWSLSVVVILFGILFVTIVNPFISVVLVKYEKIEKKYIKQSQEIISFASDGVWLKDKDEEYNNFIYSKKISNSGKFFYKVSIYSFDNKNNLVRTIFAEQAELGVNNLVLNNASVIDSNNNIDYFHEMNFKVKISSKQLQESIALPESISFWNLPDFISKLSDSGFNPIRYKSHLINQLFLPLQLLSILFLSYLLAIINPRKNKLSYLIVFFLIGSVIIFFINKFFSMLGISGKLNPYLATSFSSIIILLLSSSVILHYEDG